MEISWSAPALADLEGIDAWLTENLSGDHAVRILTAIGSRVQFLRDFPHGGRPMIEHGFRALRVPATPYLILYRIRAGRVEILRLRHEREDWHMEDRQMGA